MSVAVYDARAVERFVGVLGKREEVMLKIISDPTTTPEREASAYAQLDRIVTLQGCATLLDVAMRSNVPIAKTFGMAIYVYMLNPSEALWARVEFLLGKVTDATIALTDEVVKQAQEKTAQEVERTRREAEFARQEAARTAQEEARTRQEEQNVLQAVEETRRKRALAAQEEKRVKVADLEAQLKLEEVKLVKAQKAREDARAERERAQAKHEEHESLNWFVKIFC
jgi:hypothetical protein